ncbi:MAG TPA: TetR/AcrR family transcriptional regulator [Solirubrobacteraceae bacterium]|jgi:TetR/AcrR family transcriptional repressor of bet genes
MPRPSNTAERREQIALALGRVMAGTGYDGATITAIAREAGVAPGGVHYHFASKDEILVDLVERVVGVAYERIRERSAAVTSARDRLAAILDALLAVDEGADAHALALWSLIGAEAVRNETVRDLYAAWLAEARDRLRRAFRAACREEGRSGEGASRIAAALVALVEGSYAVAAAAPGVIPAGSAAPTARQIADALIEGQARA